jgi:Hydrolase of X-linked nucleoside diphosphate N terminal
MSNTKEEIEAKLVMSNKLLEWAQKLQAIAQNGLTYNEIQFDIER